ncbi:LacI family DNA-binding transcriptional regulator [Streptomyces sp. NPDC006465]|uniref:LacI family DNA-binding transcriptional regulator n=1 Tax=Streptomyces sp. NPDC006465 TaxID=3157174 RepID=UPI0033B6FBA4
MTLGLTPRPAPEPVPVPVPDSPRGAAIPLRREVVVAVTSADVDQAAGVSKTTVSRVLNTRGRSTRRRPVPAAR